ncbi:hypothetical protein [Marinomonas mediterranea]|jgi:hypothetical protein|uniref:Holin of 3TMs, for gene-transfer release n=1 Tax=Marinomonas mediterranea (strain ATCC 700492 / JCM 21426 / NBRC 103028 / MMB-1) TaxID=717774 RepID=F2K1R8_MARM1|nr:hypothetical protein [Marinomonas mediterranea]ADZ93402.1 hypothetical protein Marme_4203 [Marinomonas mediterranea MMB-1]WCN11290.1 hypothetical protein GV055_21320 [Marinomonas mediterranea]WCN15355.1 hypothetical protein GV054_21250 [Marinomonas mediterranea]WCN19396.1 hypothetical protein GV053_21280 [Marinomonas mediterranea MMB-1]
MMWNWIGQMASHLVGDPLKQWQTRKTMKLEQAFELTKLEHETKIAKANVALEMARQGQQQNYDLDKIAMQNMQTSWKDELVLILFLTPIVLAFIPGMDAYVHKGFDAIEKMPAWYTSIVIGMVVVIYGMRGMLKSYFQKTNMRPRLFDGRKED